MKYKCVVPSCSSEQSDSLFRFPRDPERSKKWVEKCQGHDLKEKPVEDLFRCYRLCGKHFEESAFEVDAPGSVLKDDAIPTHFDVASPPQVGQVKRNIETTKDEDMEQKGRKKVKSSQAEPVDDNTQDVPEEDEERAYLKSLFEVLVLLGEQSIPPSGPAAAGAKDDGCTSNNFQALLEYRINCGDEVLKKRYDSSKQCCFATELEPVIHVCEKYVRGKVVEEVKQNGCFSLLTDEMVKISGDWSLPVFVRYVDQSKCQRERFIGFLTFASDSDDLSEKWLSEMTENWSLDLDQCRGQAHSSFGSCFGQIKSFAARLQEKYPRATISFRATRALNVFLASSMGLSGVQLVMASLKRIESFFAHSSLLQVEFEHAISIFYPDQEDKANELKAICQSSWTMRHDVFEVLLEVVEALLLCADSVHDNEDMRWNDQVTNSALELSKTLSDFEFIMALMVLKNVLVLTQAFGRNLQGTAAEAHSAVGSHKAVMRSLKEVLDNIDVYHDFWYDEAVNLAIAMEIPVRVPRSFLRKHQGESGTIQPDRYYKEYLSVPLVNHVMSEMSSLFTENHMKTLSCLSLVPAIIEQDKSSQPEDENMQVFSDDIPNAGGLSAELHCWWVKWSKKVKGETFPSSIHETLQLSDIKFFPNVLAVLRLLSNLPSLPLQSSSGVGHQRFRAYMENVPDRFKSAGLALLHVNSDIWFNLDSLVDLYMKMCSERQEAP